jgi:hypothetical protein
MRAVNHAAAQKMTKKKDDKKARKERREWVKLDRGKRRQGLGEEEDEEDDEEEEEEGDDGVQWDTLQDDAVDCWHFLAPLLKIELLLLIAMVPEMIW